MKDTVGQALLRRRVQVVLPHVRGRLLDIGCGTNELVRAYRASHQGDGARDSLGVDVHPWPGVDEHIADSAVLPYRNAEFDTVTIIAALNHIPNRRDVLREAARILRDGGRLVVTMIPPTISRVWHLLRRPWDADQTDRGMKPGEVWGMRHAEVCALIRDAGFVVEESRRFMLGLNRLTVARRSARSTP